MLRRLLTQFGLTALIMAIGAGAALADTAPVAAPPPSDTGSTVVTGGTNAVVDTTHTTTTSVGTAVGGSNGTGTSGTPTVTTPSDGTTPTASTTTGTGSGMPSALSLTTPFGTTATPPTGSNGSPTSSPATTTTQTAHNQLVASFERAAYISGLVPVEPILGDSAAAAGLGHPAPPLPPPTPVGLLNQLHILLISTLVPATRFVQGSVRAAATSHAGLEVAVILVLATLALIRLRVPANSYTARLRRSGFLGAARSDVGGAHLLFATPREMSSIGANAPG